MLTISDAKGKPIFHGRALQIGEDFDLLGMGFYAADHDFKRSRKPIFLLPADPEKLVEAVEAIAKRIKQKETISGTGQVVWNQDSLRWTLAGSYSYTLPDVNWDEAFFPEDLGKD